ncbi:MAG: SGNH/GDSL hydrolase family protein [Planctomycetia bacterium]|nr:SGNH/GDSL hydrolase family protein [Planctomycetia bacterium]
MFVPRSFALALCLSVVFLAAGTSTANAAAPQGLGRSFQKLQKEKKLRIAYFGGSITAGQGASRPWRAQTTAWFQSLAPQAAITEVSAAADGGSEYGAFRFRKEIVEQDPDLVFVEFAVDDADLDEQRVLRSAEGIVRQFWTTNPWAEIVFIYTASKKTSPSNDRDEVPKAVGYHQAVARHYGIPAIDVGSALAEDIRSEKSTWESLTTDGVHPNDAGTAVYFRTIEAFLAAHRNDRIEEPMTSLPDPLTKDPFSGTHLMKGTTLYAPGWRKVTTPADSLPFIYFYLIGRDLFM